MSTEGGIEIRVWLGGGVVRPYDLFRIRQLETEVKGEHIVWSEVKQPEEERHTPREARRANASMRKFLKKEYCPSPTEPHETSEIMWCRAVIDQDTNWSVLLDDLMPDELWKLPADVNRECGWVAEDGEVITIEIIQGSRYHSVSYGNPDFCCAEIACAIANHVRAVLRHNAL